MYIKDNITMSNYIDTIINHLALSGYINDENLLVVNEDSLSDEQRTRYTQLLDEIDGTVDFTGDDIPDSDGQIQAAEIWEEILTNRNEYSELLEELRNSSSPRSFEDPFHISPNIEYYIRSLERQPRRPASRIEFATRIFSYLIPPETRFIFNERSYAAVSQGIIEDPDNPIETGLNILFNDDLIAPIREDHGSPLPDELAAPEHAGQRVANCLEFSTLIVTLFRVAGFDAVVTREHSQTNLESHAYVLARIGARIYQLDANPVQNPETSDADLLVTFAALNPEDELSFQNTDRETTSRHYSNEGAVLAEQDRYEQALEMFDFAIQLDPTNIQALNSKALTLFRQASQEIDNEEKSNLLALSYAAYEQVNEFAPENATAWTQRGLIRSAQAEQVDSNEDLLRDAITCYTNALQYNYANNAANRFINLKLGDTYMALNNPSEAVRYYNRALQLDPNYDEAWLARGNAMFELGNFDAALSDYRIVVGMRETPDEWTLTTREANSKIAVTSKAITRARRRRSRLENPGSEPTEYINTNNSNCNCAAVNVNTRNTNPLISLLSVFWPF